MLELRPNCEYCDKDLPVTATDAMICTYECTYCRDCVETHLHNVCPNCGGGFVPRPFRPKTAHRDGVSLTHQPASTKRVHFHQDKAALPDFVASLENTDPKDR